MANSPLCKFRCMLCPAIFFREEPGPATCDNCGGNMCEWINYLEVLSWIKKQKKK